MEMCNVFDRMALAATKPAVDFAAKQLARRGITADQVTATCFVLGMASVLIIALGHSHLALLPMVAGRVCDGLDGAVARAQDRQTDRGAFLDIALDFVFYASVPLAFALADPAQNALAGAVLLAAFISTGTSFLAFAIMAEKRGLKSAEYPSKSFYYLGGLTEGVETIAIFIAMCLWPQHFAGLALFYAALCALTTATRILAGWRTFAG
jgi:phosphatidylglycerophosphate synthase